MPVLYTTQHCPKCELAKALLHQMGLRYELSTDVKAAQALGIMSAPCLHMDGAFYTLKDIIQMNKDFKASKGVSAQ